ncbi:PREDICTED: uncharacterized protein LOC106792835, partial [Polistes canadensis]|uniref:uncharacterized protein LOC106792835 n=1 Tax=Polistes canadensis TaxID=91411 RepID=UPI000718B0DB
MMSQDFYHEDNYKEYYKVLRFFMRICGLWPYQTLQVKCFCYVMTLFLTEGVLIGQLSKLIEVRDDMEEVIDCIPNILISFFCGAEFLGLLFNSEKLKECIDTIFDDWKYLSSKTEIELLKSYTLQGRKLAILYLIYMSFTGFMFILQPIITMLSSSFDNSTNILETLPYHLRYGNLDFEKHYYKILIHSYISIMSHMLISASINLIYISFIQHACGIFAVIGYKLEHIGEDENSEISLNVKKIDDKNYWTALDCLRKHIKVIEFSELIDGSFSAMFLFTLGLHVLILAVSGTQVLIHSNEIIKAVRFGALFVSIIIQLLWQCWQAQLLLDYSDLPYSSV